MAGSWTFGPDGRTLYHYALYEPAQEQFQDLSVLRLDRSVPRVLDHRFARQARWNDGSWELEEGWHRTFEIPSGASAEITAADVDSVLEVHAPAERVALDVGPDALVGHQRRLAAAGDDLPEQMSRSELSEQIELLANSGYDITELRVAYHGKYSRAAAPLVMVLLGLPFAFQVGRRGSLYGIGIAVLLVLVYWATFAVFNALGLETLLPPYVAAWAPNVLYALLGVYLMLYIKT
jgi:lipopolysaccharide export LptBFGC system permease protein LptF